MTPEPEFKLEVGDYDLEDSFVDDIVGGNNMSDICKECLRKKIEKLEYHLMPAYPCDRWDPESRTCWLDRSIGAAVTFSLTYRNAEDRKDVPAITWQQEFHILERKDRIFFAITPDNLLWNTVISSKGQEFRISPISEADVEPNRFSAFVSNAPTPINKVHFKISLIPIDLGFVYPGETLLVSMDSYISLPIESMAYQWYMELDTESGTLPSNMKSSPSGSVLTISELRRDQNGNLSCNVYTNLGFMVARKRFVIRSVDKEKKRISQSSTHSNKSKVDISSKKQNKASNQTLKTKRRDILSKAQLQLEAALLALKYHNAQQNSMVAFGNDPNRISFQQRYSNGNNYERQQMIPRIYQPARVQQQEFVERKQDRNYHEFQPLLKFPTQIVSVRRPMQQLMTKIQPQQITKYLRPQVFQQPEAGGQDYKDKMQTINNNPNDYNIYNPDDQISILIAKCQRNTECSSHAKCVIQSNKSGFCRCLPNYRGNGITCWEFTSKLNAHLIE